MATVQVTHVHSSLSQHQQAAAVTVATDRIAAAAQIDLSHRIRLAMPMCIPCRPNNGSLGPLEYTWQTALRLVHPFLHTGTQTNRQTDRQTQRPRYICSNRSHLMLRIAVRTNNNECHFVVDVQAPITHAMTDDYRYLILSFFYNVDH